MAKARKADKEKAIKAAEEAKPEPIVQEGVASVPVLTGELRSRAIDEALELIESGPPVFMIGAGCSRAAGLPLMAGLTSSVESKIDDGATKAVWAAVKKNFGATTTANVEDYLSEIVDHIAIGSRRANRGEESPKLTISEQEFSLDDLSTALQYLKGLIASIIRNEGGELTIDVEHHARFVKAVHQRTRTGRFTSSQVKYFTLNYDTLLESALGFERIRFVDGMNGGSVAWWDPNNYDTVPAEAAVYKLHGSVDWSLFEHETFPRRLDGDVPQHEETLERVLIWPAATKYREAQRDPFAQLVERLRQSLSPQKTQSVVLVISGYSFGDDHVNHEIEAALRRSDERVQVVILLGEETVPGCVESWCQNEAYGSQVRVYYKKGFVHGSNAYESEDDCEWWKFEWLVKLIEGSV